MKTKQKSTLKKNIHMHVGVHSLSVSLLIKEEVIEVRADKVITNF